MFLLSDELPDERYDSEISKCHRCRDPTPKFRAVSTQENGRKKKVETLFDISKRLSYFYLLTMNIFVDFRELP